jgi:hypothetical protein
MLVAANDDLKWRKSSRCGESGNCVEVAERADHVLIRQAGQPHLIISQDGWGAFLRGIKAGEFDLGDLPGR